MAATGKPGYSDYSPKWKSCVFNLGRQFQSLGNKCENALPPFRGLGYPK